MLLHPGQRLHYVCFFFFNDPATTEIYTLSLHDALPILVHHQVVRGLAGLLAHLAVGADVAAEDRKSTRLNSSHPSISYAVFCLKKKKKHTTPGLDASTRRNGPTSQQIYACSYHSRARR